MVVVWSSQLNIYIQWRHIPKVGVCLLMTKCDNERDPAVSDLLQYRLCLIICYLGSARFPPYRLIFPSLSC